MIFHHHFSKFIFTHKRISMKQLLVGFVVITSLIACSFNQRIKDGEMAYERKQYAVAIPLLEEEYENTNVETAKARKAFLLGKSYLRILEYSNAKAWFGKSVDHKYGAEALSSFAGVCKSLEEYDQAITSYKQLIAIHGKQQQTDREILICQQALESKSKKPEYKIERLFENSSVADYSPALYEDNFLVFTSERKEASGGSAYNWTGEKFSDIFVMQKNGSDVRKFDGAINTDKNEGTPWFSKDMQRMYFTRCYSESSGDEYCKLMYSERYGGVWEEAEVLPFIADKINYGQCTLIENDSILVFSADIEAPGNTLDLYYAELYSDGTWSTPEKMPDIINTMGNEKFPTGDGDTLYFSSDYLPGLGGFDIFKTFLKANRKWAAPINIGVPINSGGDDFSFIVDYNGKKINNVTQQGYFTSSRNGSGKDDIFKFFKLKPEPTIDTETKVQPTKQTLFVTVKTYTPQFEVDGEPNSKVIGKLPLGESFIKIMMDVNTKLKESYSDANGFYLSEVPLDKVLKVTAAKLGYLNASANIDTKNIRFNEGEITKTINIDLVLDKIYADKEINLSNIYYDYDKWDIKAEAQPTLNALVKVLEDNPQIKIQLSSHTDCRGDDAYNENLSQKRAQSVVNDLISKGIDINRLIAKGYGESQLVDVCPCESCTEEQHQINRRTTFKILKK